MTRKVLSLLLSSGARLAQPGEFTQRAFLNGRIDLTQAEAINDLINAKNNTNLKTAIKGVKGSIRKLLDPLINDLLDIIANIEVNIDYPEYDDVEQLTDEKLLPMAKTWSAKIKAILVKSESSQMLKEGIKPRSSANRMSVNQACLMPCLRKRKRLSPILPVRHGI